MDAIAMMMGGGWALESISFFGRASPALSGPDKVLVDRLIRTLKRDGIWSKLDVLRVPMAASANALLNLVSGSYGATNHGAAFAPYNGFTGNGSSAYIDAGYQPGDGQFAAADHAFGIWVRTAAVSNAMNMGTNDGSYFAGVQGPSTTTFDGPSGQQGGPVISTGHIVVSRSSASAFSTYRSGALQSVVTGAAFSPPAFDFFLLAQNSSGSAQDHSSAQVSIDHYGAALTATEVAKLYAALSTYMTAIGA